MVNLPQGVDAPQHEQQPWIFGNAERLRLGKQFSSQSYADSGAILVRFLWWVLLRLWRNRERRILERNSQCGKSQ